MKVTEEIIKQFNISVVVNGAPSGHANPEDDHTEERFSVAKDLGIYKQINSGTRMTTDKIIDRILENR